MDAIKPEFRLSEVEKTAVVTTCDHQMLKLSPQLPAAFTEHGAIVAASIPISPEAVARVRRQSFASA